MALPDKHDPRLFKHYVKVDENGVELAIIEVAVNRQPPNAGDATLADVTGKNPDAVKATAMAHRRPKPGRG